MRDCLSVVVPFCLMPLMTKKGIKIGYALGLVGFLIFMLSGLGLMQAVTGFLDVFTESASLNTVAGVILIGILGSMMKGYGMFERIVADMRKVVRSPKLLMMILPAIMGLLPVYGGRVSLHSLCRHDRQTVRVVCPAAFSH
jgi:hypothetical protein